ncbi:hypothetical protein TrVFT333_009172 [Trichoderma virens FT-333]|nr:hypothetical protein TrVFT333_009172 [Trichoderma virens FT-333]
MVTKPVLSGRAAKLEKLFYSFINGDRSVQNSQEAKQFFEAVDVVYVRTIGYRIEKVIQLRKGPAMASIKMNYSPGGRHDNDFADFRQISIFPTADEVSSKEEPFLQRLDDVFEIPRESRTSSYISWLFRLLREDMLADLREDLQIAWGQKKAKYKPLCLGSLNLVNYDLGTPFRAKPFTLMVQCKEGINFPQNKRSPEAKKKHLDEYKNFIKHGSIGALCVDKSIIAFGSIMREVDWLIRDPPVIGIQLTDNAGLKSAIKTLLGKNCSQLKFYVVDTATFSYEPILQRLKEVTEIPIENAILDPAGPPSEYNPPPKLQAFIEVLKSSLKRKMAVDLGATLGISLAVKIRDAQLESLIKGLENPLGQIQGPPGTGKSFIGAVIARVLMELTDYRILVLSYTNHALDQFLEDLMDIGIDGGHMVRIGSKATPRTDALRIDTLSKDAQVRSSADVKQMLSATKNEQLQTKTQLEDFITTLKSQVRHQDILDMLEFSESGMSYWNAFQILDDVQIAGKNSKALKPTDILNYWLNGEYLSSLGMVAAYIEPQHYPIWNVPPPRRMELYALWKSQIRQEQVDEFAQLAETANNLYRQIDSLFKESKRNVVKNRRIIGCTTTGAAMYQSIIRAASPDIVLVEEAGEILEAHVITSLNPSVKQLILIGDHKQLRPKVNNYNLTVEKGEGFDLNVSLFERLIRQGHEFAVLQEQHRSHPDISQFARLLAYPELKDVLKTHSYQPIRGLQKRVVFVHHEHPEELLNNVSDRRDPTSKASKKNTFEAQMVLKTVKYLSQQGYKSENMVVLTPYMGQLSLLRQTLSEINDPYLNELDTHELVPCTKMMQKLCERGHKMKYMCGKENQGCKSCAKEDEEMRRRIQRDLEMEKRRQERQDKYHRDLQEMDDEIDHHKRLMKYNQEEEDQAKEIAEKKAHLTRLKETKARMEASKAAASKQKNANEKEKEKIREERSSSDWTDPDCPAQEWETMKREDGARNDALDELMGLIGLDCSLLGNPGTGKTTVARIWGKFLTGIGAIPGDCFKETTGSKLANMGVKGCEDLLEKIKEDGGGVLFIDEAYQLSSDGNLFAHNPGFPSRFPIEMNFEDYTDEELRRILKRQVNRKYNNKMEIEDGPDGLYFRIAARRVGRGRGKEGFGNARAIENTLARIEKRQANRIRLERRAKKSPNDFLFTKEDIIGPEPSLSLQNCKAWKKMDEMIGLKEVKEQVKILLDSLTTNYERELAEEPLMHFTLNRVFLGSPGTGKTTVAKLYGEILATLGLLSNGELVVKTPADFVGSHLGHSESQTKGILASTIGKVLVIDEAYGLYGGKGVTDPYKTAVIDTIVAEVQNVPGDDRCVILIGYQEQMEEMFQNVNPGLSRRFSVDTPFMFEDFDDDALRQVLDLKLKISGFTTTGEGKTAALDVLIRERNRSNFGNGGAIENLLSKAKVSYQKRHSAGKTKKNQLEAEDFDEDFDRATRKETNVRQLFQDDVGREEIIQKLENIQSRVRQLKAVGMDVKEEIPFNFLFRGPPGTGKTTTARKMGKVYYDMGFLSKATVEECSATDLIGEYVGHTGPKVQKVLEKSLGRVLLIDEAYRFADGKFAKEAIDELVDCVTKVKYQGKLIIILAGMLRDRQSKMNKSGSPVNMEDDEADSSSTPPAPPNTGLPSHSHTTQEFTNGGETNDMDEPTDETSKELESPDDGKSRRAVRDAGVSDEVWEQLQKDQAEEARRRQNIVTFWKPVKVLKPLERKYREN